MMHNTSHTRINKWNALKVKLYYELSFEFDYRILVEERWIKGFVEVKTFNDREWRLAIEMPTSEMAHAEWEREDTPAKKIKAKPEQLKISKTDLLAWP
jgi:hypothetical protein